MESKVGIVVEFGEVVSDEHRAWANRLMKNASLGYRERAGVGIEAPLERRFGVSGALGRPLIRLAGAPG